MTKLIRIICENTSLFEQRLSEAKRAAGSSPLIVLFTGEVNTATGRSWCPDCTAADPIIEDVFGSQNMVLLSCPVVREEYRDANYKYRILPDVKLKCVPTLIRWGTKMRLDDSQSQVRDLVASLLDDE